MTKCCYRLHERHLQLSVKIIARHTLGYATLNVVLCALYYNMRKTSTCRHLIRKTRTQ